MSMDNFFNTEESMDLENVENGGAAVTKTVRYSKKLVCDVSLSPAEGSCSRDINTICTNFPVNLQIERSHLNKMPMKTLDENSKLQEHDEQLFYTDSSLEEDTILDNISEVKFNKYLTWTHYYKRCVAAYTLILFTIAQVE